MIYKSKKLSGLLGTTLLVASLIVAGIYLKRQIYLSDQNETIKPGSAVMINEEEFTDESTTSEEVAYTHELFVDSLFVPWSMIFTSPERMLVTERNGSIRAIINGQLQSAPLITFPEVSTKSEEGLMGMALDPNYAQNKTLYVCLAYQSGINLFDKVVRLTDNDSQISAQATLLDKIPAAIFHSGCRLRFGPDEKLYITTGDATDKNNAQDLESLGGKILRINTDGTVPDDNPFPNSAVWSYGHRNPQGIDWHPVTGDLWQTEHGPSQFDGPPGGDEVNLIKKGENYGWPTVSHEKTQDGLVNPKLVFTPAEAPASGMFYNGDVFPQFANNFFFGALKGEGIIRVVLSSDNPEQVVAYEKLKGIQVGRVRDIVQGPDGYIYFSSSNLDGRGTAQDKDDKIYRLVPAK